MFLWSVILTWCIQIMDWPWMEKETKYLKAEEACIDNWWKITEDNKWTTICVLWWRWTNLVDIEKYQNSGSIPIYCEEEGWKYRIWYEWFEQQEVCLFDDETFCYINDFSNHKCEKWDMKYFDEEPNIPEWGWKWVALVADICKEEWWQIEKLYEWTNEQNVCYFSDDSFCYLDDLVSKNCHKWSIKREKPKYEYPNHWWWKPIEEAFCFNNNWKILINEYGDRFCIFYDWWYYELRAFKELWKMPSLRWQDEPFCSDYEDIVYWKDWVSYTNECRMRSTWMEKDPNAEFKDGKCISM